MGTEVVVFLKVFFQDYHYLDCLAEKGKPESILAAWAGSKAGFRIHVKSLCMHAKTTNQT